MLHVSQPNMEFSCHTIMTMFLITGFSDRGMPAHPGVGLLRPAGEAGERAAARPARRRGGGVRSLRRTHRQER